LSQSGYASPGPLDRGRAQGTPKGKGTHMRILKPLGLVLVVAFALSAVTASMASAQTVAKITSANGTAVTLTGKETGAGANKLTLGSVGLECPGSTYTVHKTAVTPHEALASGATSATITPHYKQTTASGEPNCKGPLGIRATIHMNGCDYVVSSGITPAGTEHTYEALFNIVCPPGQLIRITLWTSESDHTAGDATRYCIYHINPQINLGGAHLTDTNTNDGHIEISGAVTLIQMTSTESATHEGILCSTATISGGFHLDVTVENKTAGGPGVNLSH
jgi:hypothetical protein